MNKCWRQLLVCVLQAEWRADCHRMWSGFASTGLSPFSRSHPQRHQEWFYTAHIRWTGRICCSPLLSLYLFGSVNIKVHVLCRWSSQILASALRSARTSLRGNLLWGHPIGWLLRSFPKHHMALRWGSRYFPCMGNTTDLAHSLTVWCSARWIYGQWASWWWRWWTESPLISVKLPSQPWRDWGTRWLLPCEMSARLEKRHTAHNINTVN